MQFQVPQFIDVEDKIFGPLTFRQFIYVTGGTGMSYMVWRTLPQFIAIPAIVIIGGIAGAMAFAQWNGQPFIVAVEHAFYFLIHKKLYLWNNERARIATAARAAANPVAATPHTTYIPKLSDSKLHELAWSLDINERIAAGTITDAERQQRREQDTLAAVRTARQALVG
jgi:hypothetical protein